jgi:hypothetical protein
MNKIFIITFSSLFLALPGWAQQTSAPSAQPTRMTAMSQTGLVDTYSYGDSRLDKMPVDLETAYAMSALPSHLRDGATLYLLDPTKGYYVGKQGTNGFVCLIVRTCWEWGEFRQDLITPISFDPEGARTIFPLYADVAALRASGKYSPSQIKDTMISRINRGIYKGPTRSGVSYMVAPIMRVYTGIPGDTTVLTVSMPHYMFYAPRLTKEDVGTGTIPFPQLINAQLGIMGKEKAFEGYIIVPAVDSEAQKIRADGAELVKKLMAYRSYLKPMDM